MSDALAWLLSAEALGLAAFPVAYWLFPALRDRGWGFAKPIGLLAAGYLVWVLSYAGIVPNARGSYVLAGAIVLCVGLAIAFRHRRGLVAHARREWRAIALGEAVFLLMYGAWALYRAYDPAIAGTEKPMDFLFLNASAAAHAAPPTDPWLAGQPVAYYYFGYWMFGGLSLLSGVPTYVAFNLSLALTAAMAAGAVFGLSYGLVSASGGSRRAALWCAGGSVVMLLLIANLIGLWEVASLYHVGGDGFFGWLSIEGLRADQTGDSWRPTRYWWWWVGSRVINTFDSAGVGQDFTIEEFPFFSFMLGDLHPHVMSIPFVLLGLGVAANLFLMPDRWGFAWLRHNPARAVAAGLIVGALGFINAWDIATIAAVLGAVVVLKVYRTKPVSFFGAAVRAMPPLLIICGVGLLAYAPFYFGTFSSQVQPAAPIGGARFPTRPVHFLTVWGLWLVVLMPLFLSAVVGPVREYAAWAWRSAAGAVSPPSAHRPAISPLWLTGLALGVPFFIWAGIHLEVNDGATVSDLAYRFLSVLPLAVAVAASSIAAFSLARRRPADGRLFALAVLSIVLYLLYGVELLFIHDFFGNRMNTIFKVYYQVWIMLSVVAGVAIYHWTSQSDVWRGWRLRLSRGAGVLAAVLLAFAFYYPFAAASTKASSAEPSLDGLAHVGDSEREAIEWLRDHARRNDVLVEAVGGGYTEFGRVSSSTGVPTVLNWPGHERQWRGKDYDFGDRESDVERIYVTTEAEEARRLLGKYHVRYVYIGERERSKYPSLAVSKFDQIASRIEFGSVVIYEVQEPAAFDRPSS
jgi:YYY domain-containing protein